MIVGGVGVDHENKNQNDLLVNLNDEDEEDETKHDHEAKYDKSSHVSIDLMDEIERKSNLVSYMFKTFFNLFYLYCFIINYLK